MKFGIFAVAAFWFVKLASANSAAFNGVVDLKVLKFNTWAKPASGCPLGTLPDGVFLHKTVDHNGVHFTWVLPVHGLVKELKCDSRAVWKGLDGELLVDFHFFGKTDGDMFVHLEHLTKLGGVAHVFLKFAHGALDKPVALGLAGFVAGVAALFDAAFLNVKGLPAHALLHELALHHAA